MKTSKSLSMEVEIVEDEPSNYTVTINHGGGNIQTNVSDFSSRHFKITDETEWVKEIRKTYFGKDKKKKKSGQKKVAIGLSAEHSLNYKHGNNVFPTSAAKDVPYELIQICIGNHCLIYQPSYAGTRLGHPLCKALRELLSDNNVFVFGIEMDVVAKKIEKDFRVKLSNPCELRKLAECAKNLKPGYYGKYNLEKLAVEVLGRERELEKPDRIHWFTDCYYRIISEEKIKYGTVDAFLAYEMGTKFLEEGTIEAYPEYEKRHKYLRSRYGYY